MKDIHQSTLQDQVSVPTGIPYFEGDSWPKVCEKIAQEEKAEKIAAEAEKNGKKGCSQPQYGRKKKSKPATARKRKDFAALVLARLEKDKSAFFTITLISSEKVANLKPMQEDVAEQQSSNVMESRDSILAYFRKNHLEFTTLRHAQYATLCMLIELQSQCNVIVYRCNTCIAEIIGSRFHCPVCDAFFTITLISSEKVADFELMEEDVDELQSGNMMECRDSFLAYCRTNHLEFSTLRHAQYATLCMLIELQSQCNENVIGYRCNTCMAEIIGSRFHCPECKDFYLVLSAIRNAAMIT
ncbi:protein cbp-1-like [Sycon ciliatum]|uniref:protein cbp-1-like n=1 Tax=Sycon ciliatum TaxID=27933 RepID=UPI0031F63AAC